MANDRLTARRNAAYRAVGNKLRMPNKRLNDMRERMIQQFYASRTDDIKSSTWRSRYCVLKRQLESDSRLAVDPMATFYDIQAWLKNTSLDVLDWFIINTYTGIGDIKMAVIRKTLDHLGYIRTQEQKEFHHAFLKQCLPYIYGHEWDSHSERVLAAFEQTKMQSHIHLSRSRAAQNRRQAKRAAFDLRFHGSFW